jgi:hypothetical protein
METPAVHYHIRFLRETSTKLDPCPFESHEEAETAAQNLVLPHETYSIVTMDREESIAFLFESVRARFLREETKERNLRLAS